MRIRNAGLAALVAAAGIWMSFSGDPAMAAKSTAKSATKTTKAAKTATSANRPVVLSKFKKPRVAAKKSRPAKAASAKSTSGKSKASRYARKRGAKVASKVIEAPETWEDKPVRKDTQAAANPGKTELPVSVANARAQALADDEARNYSALDSSDVVDGAKFASADQPNSSDAVPDNNAVVAQEAAPPTPPIAPGKILRPMPSGDRPVVKTADDSDPWSKTSLIGKIFIAFGSLLTLASAARLLIA